MRARHLLFLRDVLTVAFTAFGGPQAHIAVFLKRFCEKRNYLSENDLLEIYSVCQMLPGPTSTQVITAIGYKMGGYWIACFTLLVWILPAVSFMLFFSFLFTFNKDIKQYLFIAKFIPPLAVAFMIYGFTSMSKKIIVKKTYWIIVVLSAIGSVLINTPLAFPVILILSGIVTSWLTNVHYKPKKVEVNWTPVILFVIAFLIIAFFSLTTKGRHIAILENNFRFGSLVFGGGQVLFPMMYEQYVSLKKYLTYNEFFSGYGFLQMMPGPVFSFATYTASLSCRQFGVGYQLAGAALGTIGIFLPGLFFVLFFFPLWNKIKNNPYIYNSIQGITSAALGLILGAAFTFAHNMEQKMEHYAYIVLAFLLLYFLKLRSGQMVVISIIAAIAWQYFSYKV